MSFLCRVSEDGPHMLHVHDTPSYDADVLRHQEMGWRMAGYCQRPFDKASDGDPGVKPFQVLDVTTYAPGWEEGKKYRDAQHEGVAQNDHHTKLLPLGDYDYDGNRRRLHEVIDADDQFHWLGDQVEGSDGPK